MPTDLPKREPRGGRQHTINWMMASLSVPATLIVLMSIVPMALVLPTIAVITVSASAGLALCNVRRRRATSTSRELVRDAAGLLLLIGFGASMMTDASAALQAFADVQAWYGAGSSHAR